MGATDPIPTPPLPCCPESLLDTGSTMPCPSFPIPCPSFHPISIRSRCPIPDTIGTGGRPYDWSNNKSVHYTLIHEYVSHIVIPYTVHTPCCMYNQFEKNRITSGTAFARMVARSTACRLHRLRISSVWSGQPACPLCLQCAKQAIHLWYINPQSGHLKSSPPVSVIVPSGLHFFRNPLPDMLCLAVQWVRQSAQTPNSSLHSGHWYRCRAVEAAATLL